MITREQYARVHGPLLWISLLLSGCGSKGDDGATGAAGPTGPAGPAGTTTVSFDGGTSTALPAAVNGISPPAGLLGRELDVIVSGDGTSFDSTSTLDFGAGITVTNVSLVSRAALSAHLSIDVGATVGPHDVSVGGGGSVGTAHGAFLVKPSLLVTPVMNEVAGPLVGGGIGGVYVSTVPGEEFGTAALQGGVFGGVVSTVDNLEDPLLARTITGDQFNAFVLVDPVAPTGGGQMVIAEPLLLVDGGTAVRRLYASDPAALAVTATPPVTLTLPATTTANLAANGAATYKMTTTGTGILALAINSPNEPYATFFGPSGKALDQIVSAYPSPAAVLPFTDTSTRDTYASIVNSGQPAHSFVPGFSFTAATVTAEQISPHACTAPQAVTLPAIITGTVDSAQPADCFSFTTTVGTKIGYSFMRTGTVNPATVPNVNLTTCSGSGTGNNYKALYEQDTATTTACKFSVQATTSANSEVFENYVLTVRAIP